MDYSILIQIGVAVLLSALVGLEREQKYQLSKRGHFAGFRTFALIGMLGALSYILGQGYPIIFYILAAGMFLFVMVSHLVTAGIRKGGVGITSEIATVIIYIVGVMCAMEMYVLATSVALTTLAFLHFKIPLHKWAKRVQDEELLSTLQFVIIAFVVLPLLPDKGYGPYEIFNPYIIWLMVVLISGISFLSYITIKILGPRKGIGVSGFLGGLISSTALTLSFSGESKKNPLIVCPYVFSVIMATIAMFLRVLIAVAIINKDLLSRVIVPVVAMGVGGIVCAWHYWRKKDSKDGGISESIRHQSFKLKSPFSLIPALKFGVLFGLILFLSRFMTDIYGDKGFYVTSVFSGIIDMDAIVVSAANLTKNGVAVTTAAMAIIIAIVTNVIAKGGMFALLGNKKVAIRLIFSFLVMVACGGAALILEKVL